MHTVYVKYISLYISLFQIRKYSYIAYDNLFQGIQIVTSKQRKQEKMPLLVISPRLNFHYYILKLS